MVNFLNLPTVQAPRNALADLSPIGNAIDGNRRNALANLESQRQDKELALRTSQAEQTKKLTDLEYRSKIAQRSAGVMQMAMNEKDPARKAAIVGRLYSEHPEFQQNLAAHGIDPNDHDTAARFVIAEARGYVSPEDTQLKQLQIQNAQSSLSTDALQRKQLQMKIDQENRFNSMFDGGFAPAQAVESTDAVGSFAQPKLTQQPAQQNQIQAALAKLPPEQQTAFMVAWRSGERDQAIKILQSAGTATSYGEKAVDKNFAKTYEEDIASGGLNDALANAKTLRGIAAKLSSPDAPNVTGPWRGLLPDGVNSIVNPEAVDIKNNVGGIIQRTLRPVLGAQFTEKEGENLIARAYNPQLSEAQNAKRLERIAGVAERMAQAKLKAAQYFETNGTLKGFKGSTQFSVEDVYSAIDAMDTPSNKAGGETSKKKFDLGDGFTAEVH